MCENDQIIYADPPWRYDTGSVMPYDSIEYQYPTMDLKEIQDLELPVDTNAILFLWSTAPKLEEALSVMKSWGFVYKTCSIWDKKNIGLGYYFRNQHEILLVGIKGNIRKPFTEDRVSSVYGEKKTEHSRKPEFYHGLIEKMYPEFRKLELFARRKRDGWECWGNEKL